jgi:hypothetical protein
MIVKPRRGDIETFVSTIDVAPTGLQIIDLEIGSGA